MTSLRSSHTALFAIAAVAVATALFARFWLSGAVSSGRADSPAEISSTQLGDPNDPLAAFYRARLGGILRDFAAAGLSLETVTATRESVLALRVPEMYRDLHLQIVLALSRAADGLLQGSDVVVITRAWDDFLQTISAIEPWLAR